MKNLGWSTLQQKLPVTIVTERSVLDVYRD